MKDLRRGNTFFKSIPLQKMGIAPLILIVPEIERRVKIGSRIQRRSRVVCYSPSLKQPHPRCADLWESANYVLFCYPLVKLRQFLSPVKDDLGLWVPGIYQVPCSCGRVYIGPTECMIVERCVEHARYIRLKKHDKSGLADHWLTEGHEALYAHSPCSIQENWGLGESNHWIHWNLAGY